jgi:hypothetical protein
MYLAVLQKKHQNWTILDSSRSAQIFPSEDFLLYFRLFHKANVIPVDTLVYQINLKSSKQSGFLLAECLCREACPGPMIRRYINEGVLRGFS